MASPRTGSVLPGVLPVNFDIADAAKSEPVVAAETPAVSEPRALPAAASTDGREAKRPPVPASAPLYGSPTDPRRAFGAMNFGPNAAARASAIRSPSVMTQSPNWGVDNQYNRANSVFTAADTQAMSVLGTSGASRATIDYMVQRGREFHAAGDVAGWRQWLAEKNTNLIYRSRSEGGGPASTLSPEEMARLSGLCRDYAYMDAAVSREAGFDAGVVGYSGAGGISHAVPVIGLGGRNYGVVEYGRNSNLDGTSMMEAARAFSPSALSFRVYGDNGIDNRSSVVGTLYTDVGLRYFDATRAADQAAPIGQSGAAVGTDGLAATVAVGSNTNVFARAFSGVDGLDGTVLGGIAHRLSPGVQVTLGGGQMMTRERTIGPRELMEQKYTVGFASVTADGDLHNRQLAPGLRFESNYNARVSVGAGFGAKGLDKDFSSGLMDTNISASAGLVGDINPNLQAYGRATVGVGSGTMYYVSTDGLKTGGLAGLPLDKRVEAGVRYTQGNGFVDVGGVLPIGRQQSNLADRPAVDVRAGYVVDSNTRVQVGARASMGSKWTEVLPEAATSGARLDAAYVGAERSFGALTAGVEAYAGTQYNQAVSGARISLRMDAGSVTRAIGGLFR